MTITIGIVEVAALAQMPPARRPRWRSVLRGARRDRPPLLAIDRTFRRPTIFDLNAAALDVAASPSALRNAARLGCCASDEMRSAIRPPVRLLRARGERPKQPRRRHAAAEERDELPPPHFRSPKIETAHRAWDQS